MKYATFKNHYGRSWTYIALALFTMSLYAGIAVLVRPGNAAAIQNSVYRIVAVHSNKCMDVTGASTADLAPIQQWTCLANHDNQRFRFTQVSSGIWRIQALHSNKCLDVRNASTANGAQLQQFTCQPNNPGNQKFHMVEQGSALPGQYEIMPFHSYLNNKCLAVNGGVSSDGALVIQNQCTGIGSQRWRLVQ